MTDDGRTPDHGHPIISPCEPKGSGELKKKNYLPLMSMVALICGRVQDWELQGPEFESRLGTMFTLVSLSKTH